MFPLGQFGPITVWPNREVEGTFTVESFKSLNKASQPCESDDQYSYNECLRSYVTRTTNCSIDIFSNNFDCTFDGFEKLQDTFGKIKISSKSETTKESHQARNISHNF